MTGVPEVSGAVRSMISTDRSPIASVKAFSTDMALLCCAALLGLTEAFPIGGPFG
jgi:hypothetical protein